ncbi:MAG: ABC transporter permease [Angustibacter sp.]
MDASVRVLGGSPWPRNPQLLPRIGVQLQAFVGAVQSVLYIAVALTPPFGLRLVGSWWLIAPLLLCGTLAFVSIGLLIGSIVRTEEAASAVANVVVLPMAFLSGTFFPIEDAPTWLQTASQVFPLRHLTDGMLAVLGRGQGLDAVWQPCLVLIAFAGVLTAIATRFFRWDTSA